MDNATRVIVINFNAGEAVQRCVASVLANREPLELVVADNASTDGSCQALGTQYSADPRFTLLENGQNLGFARAVNACAKPATEPYLLILNPDCELCPGALAGLRKALQDAPQAGLAAPRVVDREGRVLRGTLRSFPDPWKALVSGSGLWRLGRWIPKLRGVEAPGLDLPDRTVKAEAVSGACMLLRRELFARLGGFDEGYGLHFEDLDLMYRLHQSGHDCLYVPGARVIHQPGTSSRSRPWWVHRQKHLGMRRFFRTHYSAAYSPLSAVLLEAAIWMHYLLSLPLVFLRR